MIERVKKFFPLAFLVIVIILGTFFLWDWLGGEGVNEFSCEKLTENRLISATGSFDSHNEGLIYIGDVVELSVRVIYNNDRVEIKERSLQNFNLSPYKRISQSSVETRKQSGCSEKNISFTIQALDVSPGSKNSFKFADRDGFDRPPRVEYVKDGILSSITPTYEAPLVAPLTDGGIHRIPSNAKSYPILKEFREDVSWSDIARFYTGVAIILSVIVLVAAPYALSKWRGESPQDLSQPLLIGDLFPELLDAGMSHERLTRAYFRIEKLLEFLEAGLLKENLGELFKERVLLVFSGELSDEQESEVLLQIHNLIEENWDEILMVMVYEKIGEAWS